MVVASIENCHFGCLVYQLHFLLMSSHIGCVNLVRQPCVIESRAALFWLQYSLSLCPSMGFASAVVSLCFTLRTCGAVESGPTFPDGIAAVVADMRDRMSSSSAGLGDDSQAVANLKQRGLDAIAEDLAQDQQSTHLETVAFAMVQSRLLKLVYVGGCPRDMSGCPTFWAEQSNGVCEPPEDYDGLCVAIDVKGLAVEEKEDFAWKCRASWPCTPSCKLDFEGCPATWQNLNGLCLAPSVYDGICSPAMLFSSFTPKQKAEWAAMCSARWPCVQDM